MPFMWTLATRQCSSGVTVKVTLSELPQGTVVVSGEIVACTCPSEEATTVAVMTACG